jgi:hypothetical protein
MATHSTREDCGDFNLTVNDDGTWGVEKIQAAILADIRRELRALNRVIGCHNAIDIPNILRRIDANTKKPARKKKK